MPRTVPLLSAILIEDGSGAVTRRKINCNLNKEESNYGICS
jgi:hypothetical protein